MLKQVNKIHDFGVFSEFKWDTSLKPFQLFNLSYGWNYSGKTTFSRVLRSYELGAIHPDYPNSSFELEDIANVKFSESSLPSKLKIRVFNSDFIHDNLKWNINTLDEIEPILILGIENIALQTKLEETKKQLLEKKDELERLSIDDKLESERIASALSRRAGDIKQILVLTTFDKRHLEAEVKKCFALEDPDELLPDTEVSNLVFTYKSTEKKEIINKVDLIVPNLVDIVKSANLLLSATVKSKIIERLKNSEEINEWVKKGKELHVGKTTCEFCTNVLPEDLLENLNNHFSKDYENLILSLQEEKKNNEKSIISIALPDSANFYSDLQREYLGAKKLLESYVASVNDTIDTICRKLEDKQVKVFEELQLTLGTDNSIRVSEYLNRVNYLIGEHNKKSQNFEVLKAEAYSTLLKNYAREFVVNENYAEYIDNVAETQRNIKNKLDECQTLEVQITEIEKQLSETVKGAEKINEYLDLYFGKKDIRVIVTPENKFQLHRNSIIAKNLSEGEKTAIAFAYFVTRLEDKDTNLSDTIVYIDDPISSLDSNHLFNTYSFIKDKFYYYDKTEKKHKCKAAQFFISTHNFEFFNLIKDWYSNMKEADKSFYLFERIVSSAEDKSTIKPMPVHLLKYKSEYTYLFSIIYSFKINPSSDFNQLYNLPNIIRRFIETLTAFKYLSTRNIDENLARLITDSIKCERVRKFAHYHSHSLSTNKLIQFTDLTECISVIDILLDSIKTVDEEHYNSLINEVIAST